MLKKLSSYTFALLGLALLFSSCKKEYESIESIDERKIQEYLSANKLNFIKDPTGFYYRITDPGSAGNLLTNSDSVLYTYDIQNLSGTVYSTTGVNTNDGTYVGYVNPVSYRSVLTKIKRGGKFSVILPSYLAFGKNGSGSIPSNEVILSNISTYSETSQAALDEDRIIAYLASKGLTETGRVDGVHYIVTTPSTGTVPVNLGSSLTIKYTGRLLDGTVFDSSTDGTFVTILSGVIKGWQKVLPRFSTGAKIRIFVPSGLGYGTSAQSTIPANSILDFDIEITAVTN